MLPRIVRRQKTSSRMLWSHCPARQRRRIRLSDIPAQGHRDNRLLAAMPPDIFALLERDLSQLSLKQGAVLFEPDEPIGTVYFPQTGLISLTIVGRNGKELETSI